MAYSSQVEQWRSLVEKYFPANLVDKALYVISGESGGHLNNNGDGGRARGLFQIQTGDGRPSAAWLDNPENNIKYAAQSLGAANNKWTDWGENSLYNGKPFGALGNHPYTGSTKMITANGDGHPEFGPGSAGFNPGPKTTGSTGATGTGGTVKIGDKTYDPDLGKWLVVDGFDMYGEPTYSYVSAASGSGNNPDHFYDVSPGDQYTMDRNARNDARQIANDDRTYNYNVGRDTITDARNTRDFDYGVGRDARADFNSDRTFGAGVARDQNDFNARMAEIAQSRETSNNNYAIGIANAQNDGERNNITQRWNEEQSRIAKMENETKLVLGQQSNQTNQFGAETNRATGMGQLALDNNKFIADMARSPRDLFSLYFMQRGMAPDWDGMAAGNAPAHGAALAPSSVMHAYDPVTASPTFNFQGGAAAAAVGTHPYTAQTFTPPPLNPAASAFTPPAYVPSANPTFSAPAQIPFAPPKTTQTPSVPLNGNPAASGSYGNAFKQQAPPDALNRPAGKPAYQWSDAQQGWINPESQKMEDGLGHYWNTATQQYHNMNDDSVYVAMAEGGYTTARNIMAGDANDPNPSAGGAKPERIFNPTGAPLAIEPHPTQDPARGASNQMFSMPQNGTSTQANTTMGSDPRGPSAPTITGPVGSLPAAQPMMSPPQQVEIPYGQDNRMFQMPQQGRPAMPAQAPAYGQYGTMPRPNPERRPMNQAWDYQSKLDASAGRQYAQKQDWYKRRMMMDFGQRPHPSVFRDIPTFEPPSRPQADLQAAQAGWEQALAQGQYGDAFARLQQPDSTAANAAAYANSIRGRMPTRFALGTQGEYEANGMGSAYIPSSTNSHISGEMPRRLQNLIDYGAPIPPSLVANATGGVAPTLNMGSALQQRGGGTGASLQTLRNQTKGETELYKGFVEGNNGISFADFTDWLAKPTEFLKGAQRSGGI